MKMKNVLIVEDDLQTLDLISNYFKKNNFITHTFSSANGVYDYVLSNHIDLCILDVMIGNDNGFDLIKEIKSIKDIPVIFVTAKDDEFDRIYGIEIGADDYLTKPFSPRELVARSKRLLTRLEKNSEKDKVITCRELVINTDTMGVVDKGNKIQLTLKEYSLLVYLVENKNRVQDRELIVEKVWGYDALGQTRMVDDLIKRLRKKLSIEIETIWGVGYRVNE
jgi:DNA-binding response OmpR family regulator